MRSLLAPSFRDVAVPRSSIVQEKSFSVVRSATRDGDVFSDAKYSDLIISTESRNQRVLFGVGSNNISGFDVDSVGVRLRGEVDIVDNLNIQGRINMVGGFEIANGVEIQGEATIQSNIIVKNRDGDLLLSVDEEGLTAKRDTSVDAQLFVLPFQNGRHVLAVSPSNVDVIGEMRHAVRA